MTCRVQAQNNKHAEKKNSKKLPVSFLLLLFSKLNTVHSTSLWRWRGKSILHEQSQFKNMQIIRKEFCREKTWSNPLITLQLINPFMATIQSLQKKQSPWRTLDVFSCVEQIKKIGSQQKNFTTAFNQFFTIHKLQLYFVPGTRQLFSQL